MIESRDSYTAGHTKRVANYCVLIAKEMKITRVTSFKKEELIYKILDQQAIISSTKPKPTPRKPKIIIKKDVRKEPNKDLSEKNKENKQRQTISKKLENTIIEDKKQNKKGYFWNCY